MVSNRAFFHSMRARMTSAFVLLTTVLLLSVGGGILSYLRYAAAHTVDTALDLAATRLRSELAENPNDNGYNEFLSDNGDSLKMEGIALLVMDAEGRLVQRTQSVGPPWPHRPEDGWKIRTVRYGARLVVIGADWRKSEMAWRREAVMLVTLGLCVVVASGFGAWWLVGRTLAPIFALSQQARQAAETDRLHLRLTVPSEDAEVVELVATLNGLLSSIGKTAEARGRFYAAASHELRTPLQALSGHLEVALSRERTREEYKTATEEASRQTQRLSALIQGLLLLNQLDRLTPATLPRETVDLSEICRRLLPQFQPLLDQRQLTLSSDLSAAAIITAFPQHVEMLIRNLIENACKYAPVGGSVRILLAADSIPALKIFNSFPMHSRLDTEALFEPFSRPDEARTSETGGNGLGLAICRAIAAANGWHLTLDQVESGVCVRIIFSSPH